MKVKKRTVRGWVELEYIKIKDYRCYGLYGVYLGGVCVYKTCLTDLDLRELEEHDYILEEVDKCM